MVASMVRHFESLRLMRRDNAWISTLLQEAENEVRSVTCVEGISPATSAPVTCAEGISPVTSAPL